METAVAVLFGFRCALRGFTAHTPVAARERPWCPVRGLSAAGRHSDAWAGKRRPTGGVAVSHALILMTPQLREGGREIEGPAEFLRGWA